jgi:hypothetical protein
MQEEKTVTRQIRSRCLKAGRKEKSAILALREDVAAQSSSSGMEPAA